MYNENNFLKALSQSFENYLEYGARSTKKLKPIHLFLANTLQSIFGQDYETHYLGENSKELTVEGKYYPKDIDITVTHNKNPIFCLGLKFVTSNYKQNANNYFEGMMGETTCEVKKIKPNSVSDTNFAEVLETKVSVSNLFQEVSTFAKFYKTQL